MPQTVAAFLTPAFFLNFPSLTRVRTLRHRHTAGFPGYPVGQNKQTRFTAFICKSLIDPLDFTVVVCQIKKSVMDNAKH